MPTYQDVIDLFTLGSTMEDSGDLGTTFGGGVQTAFSSLSLRKFITFCIWAAATGVLVIYSYVIYWKFSYSWLGFITMIAVLLTDVFVFFLWNSKIVTSVTLICVAILANRLLLYVFGGNYWIYGYMVMYLAYGAIFSVLIMRKRFPFEDVYANIHLSTLNKRRVKSDISKAPEFLLAFLTSLLVILFIVLLLVQPTGVPLLSFTVNQRDFPFYVNGLFCLLIVAAFFASYCVYRLFMRKMRKIEPQLCYYILNVKFDIYWIFITVAFVLLLCIGLIAFWITQEASYVYVVVFATLFVVSYMNAYLHYVMNDFQLFQDVAKMNASVQKHNAQVVALRDKVVAVRQDIMDGKANAVGSDALGLAKSILEQEKLQRAKVRRTKRITQQNELFRSMKTSVGNQPPPLVSKD